MKKIENYFNLNKWIKIYYEETGLWAEFPFLRHKFELWLIKNAVVEEPWWYTQKNCAVDNNKCFRTK